MNDNLAFVGDVHGNIEALHGILDALAATAQMHLVFLGDYVNKGTHSAEVLELLLEKQRAGEVTLLAGNHETALLEALDSANLTGFLKMGGATTIRSYLRRPARADVLDDFRTHFPLSHLEGVRAMPLTWEADDVVAQHVPSGGAGRRFSVSAHVPVGLLPRITATAAQIDTGGGSNGRLSALMWPSRNYVQVDAAGHRVF